MYVFGGGNTCVATSSDGYHFSVTGRNWACLAMVQSRRFCSTIGDCVSMHLSSASPQEMHLSVLFRRTASIGAVEDVVRLKAANNEQITDPFVIRWKGGYKMYFKVEPRNPTRLIPQISRPPEQSAIGVYADTQGQPIGISLVHGITMCLFIVSAIMERLKNLLRLSVPVPTVACLKDGRLIAAHQHFPENNDVDFDKVAVRFSSDEGKSWTPAQVIKLDGLPDGMRFPFDPTLVPLPDGRVRLYFTSLKGRRFEEDRPAIYSAVSNNGIVYKVEPGVRFGIEGRPVIDCAVVLHQGVFHLYAPDNGTGGPPDKRGAKETSSSGCSRDPVLATMPPVRMVCSLSVSPMCKSKAVRRWVSSAKSDGKLITFFGTGEPGIWMATGRRWTKLETNEESTAYRRRPR